MLRSSVLMNDGALPITAFVQHRQNFLERMECCSDKYLFDPVKPEYYDLVISLRV